jgi:hypothetical protein
MSIDAYKGVDHSLQAGPASGRTMDDRRSIVRTRIAKAASLFFSGKTGIRSCEVSVTDITNGGAGIHTQGLAALPLNFELYVDNFRRKCRLAWRNGNFFGVAFEDQGTQSHGETKMSEADAVAIPGPALLALNDPPQFTYLANGDGLSEYTSKALDPGIQRQADLRFAIGAAIALALPVLVGMSIYIAMTAILGAS